MSTKISRVKILSGELRISKSTLLKWRDERHRLPENSPIDLFRHRRANAFSFTCSNGHKVDLVFCSTCGESMEGLDNTAVLDQFWWRGVGSTNSYDDGTLVEFLQDLEGDADIIFEWDGYGPSGVRKKGNKVTFHEVVQVLGDETPPT